MRRRHPESQPRVRRIGGWARHRGRIRSIIALCGCAATAFAIPRLASADACSPSSTTLVINAAILSRSAARLRSFIAPNWGECWNLGNLDIQNPLSTIWPPATVDPWVKGRTESMIIGSDSGGGTWYADGLSDGGFSLTPLPTTSLNYLQPYHQLAPANMTAWADYRDTFSQHQHLPWPHCSYERMKTLAIFNHRPIFRTTPDGQLIIGYDGQGNPIIQSFDDVFDRAGQLDPDSVDRHLLPPVYFVDTIDGQAPREDGANLATIRLNASGPFYYGFFFLAAHVQFNGAGFSPVYDMPEKPDQSISEVPIGNCRLMGLFYSYAAMELLGTGNVYGSLCAERGFLGDGTWAVYYDWRLHETERNRLYAGPTFATPTSTVAESQPELLIPVVYGGDDLTPVTFEYAVAGGTAKGDGIDYTLAPGTLEFVPGVYSQSIRVQIVDDPDFELPETIVIEIRKPFCSDSPPLSTHTVTILSDDPLHPASTGCLVH